MKDIKNKVGIRAEKILKRQIDFLEMQLLLAGIELGIFDFCSKSKTLEELIEETHYNPKNLELFLDALVSGGFLIKEGNVYANTVETDTYLVKNRKYYLGDYVRYWHQITNLQNLATLVKKGTQLSEEETKYGAESYDFAEMGKAAENEIYLNRVPFFIKLIENQLSCSQELKVLDLGGGSGYLGIELAKKFEKAKVTVFDQKQVIEQLTEKNIAFHKMSEKVKTQCGDFNMDDFGEGYDLIIASGIYDFMKNPEKTTRKMAEALSKGGVLYVSACKINDAFTQPKGCILRWLKARLEGSIPLKTENEIKNALVKAGFVIEEVGSSTMFGNYFCKMRKEMQN